MQGGLTQLLRAMSTSTCTQRTQAQLQGLVGRCSGADQPCEPAYQPCICTCGPRDLNVKGLSRLPEALNMHQKCTQVQLQGW